MRELTFKGFLTQYVKSLSESGKLGLYRLAEEAASKNPRLREPLFLYAVFSDKTDVLLRAVKNPKLHARYSGVLLMNDKTQIEALLIKESQQLLDGYLKVYRSYLSVKNKADNDTHTKTLMHKRATKLLSEKRVSHYRVYTDLKLNPGNVNTFLRNGDTSKIGLGTARRVIEYLENY